MTNSGKSAATRIRRALLNALARERGSGETEASRARGKTVRHFEIDGRVRPLVLVAESLLAVESWSPGADPAPLLGELKRCMDEMLKLRELLPESARPRFDALDNLVQYVDLCQQEAPDLLASSRGELIARVLALGDVLLALWGRTED